MKTIIILSIHSPRLQWTVDHLLVIVPNVAPGCPSLLLLVWGWELLVWGWELLVWGWELWWKDGSSANSLLCWDCMAQSLDIDIDIDHIVVLPGIINSVLYCTGSISFYIVELAFRRASFMCWFNEHSAFQWLFALLFALLLATAMTPIFNAMWKQVRDGRVLHVLIHI